MASSLLEGNKEDSKKRFDYYKKLDEESKKELMKIRNKKDSNEER